MAKPNWKRRGFSHRDDRAQFESQLRKLEERSRKMSKLPPELQQEAIKNPDLLRWVE